jgi:ParB family chromosome partitioning protein
VPRTFLRLEQIKPNSFQPRKHFDAEALAELANSIRAHGILQPPVVRSLQREGESEYELIAGERRWRAAKIAGLAQIAVIVKEQVTDEQMLELALVENVQRQELDPMERAEGYRDLMGQLGLTQEAVAMKVGLRRSTVTNHLRLLDLPKEAQQAVRQNLISMGHARALLGLSKPMEILTLVQRIAREGLSVRQVEQLIRSHKGRTKQFKSPAASEQANVGNPVNATIPPWQRELEGRMRDHLGCKVKLRNGPDFRGDIVIEYYDRADLDRLCDILAPRKSL